MSNLYDEGDLSTTEITEESLSKDVFERRPSTRSGRFFGSGLAQNFEQIVSIRSLLVQNW